MIFKRLSNLKLWKRSLYDIQSRFGNNAYGYFKLHRWLLTINMLCAFQICILMAYKLSSKSTLTKLNLRESIFFYADYSSHSGIPKAYFLAMSLVYFTLFIGISIRMSHAYRSEFAEQNAEISTVYVHKILWAWQYSISTVEAAELKRRSIYLDLKGTSRPPLKEVHRKGSFYIFINMMICLLLIPWISLIWLFLKKYGLYFNCWVYAAFITSARYLWRSETFHIFYFESSLSPVVVKYIHLLRSFLFELSTIVTFQIFLMKSYMCWETTVGYFYGALIFCELLMDIFIMPMYSLLHCLSLRRAGKPGPPFNYFLENQNLIYTELLTCAGILFAPILMLLVVLKLFVGFYLKKKCLAHVYAYEPDRTTLRPENYATCYLVFAFICFLLIFLGLAYIMIRVPLSMQCGPLRDYAFMLSFLVEGFLPNLSLKPGLFIIRPAVVGAILIFLSAFIYYVRVKSLARSALVHTLRTMLVKEKQDRECLINQIKAQINQLN